MAKASSLLDEVKATLSSRRGPTSWIDSLPVGLADEVAAIKAQWLDGKLATTKTALARSLAKGLQDRGVPIGFSGVVRWLEKP
jgi:hypothetical protein